MQEPGRNLAGMPLVVAGPHVQPLTVTPGASVTPDGKVGVRVIDFPSIVVSPKPWAVTVITPALLVATEATYFDELPEDSQPQLPPLLGSVDAV